MRGSYFLNQNETYLLEELDRFVDGFKRQTGKKPPELILSHRQMNAMRRILEKVKEKPDYDFSRKFDLAKKTYRGIPIIELDKMRRYRRRKDMMELPL